MQFELLHATDIAIRPSDDRDSLERAFQVSEDFYIPSSARGEVVGGKIIDGQYLISVGDTVHFDPRMMIEIPELGIVIVDKKSILLKAV